MWFCEDSSRRGPWVVYRDLAFFLLWKNLDPRWPGVLWSTRQFVHLQ